jgi:hypothetical protein
MFRSLPRASAEHDAVADTRQLIFPRDTSRRTIMVRCRGTTRPMWAEQVPASSFVGPRPSNPPWSFRSVGVAMCPPEERRHGTKREAATSGSRKLLVWGPGTKGPHDEPAIVPSIGVSVEYTMESSGVSFNRGFAWHSLGFPFFYPSWKLRRAPQRPCSRCPWTAMVCELHKGRQVVLPAEKMTQLRPVDALVHARPMSAD